MDMFDEFLIYLLTSEDGNKLLNDKNSFHRKKPEPKPVEKKEENPVITTIFWVLAMIGFGMLLGILDSVLS